MLKCDLLLSFLTYFIFSPFFSPVYGGCVLKTTSFSEILNSDGSINDIQIKILAAVKMATSDWNKQYGQLYSFVMPGEGRTSMSAQAAREAGVGPAVASMMYADRSMSLPLLASWSAWRLRRLSMELSVICDLAFRNRLPVPGRVSRTPIGVGPPFEGERCHSRA